MTIITRSSPQIAQLVSSQSLDFGFADSDVEVPTTGQYRTDVMASRYECALPVGHPLAGLDQITAQDLDGMPMGLLLPDHFSHIRTKTAFEAADARLDVQMES